MLEAASSPRIDDVVGHVSNVTYIFYKAEMFPKSKFGYNEQNGSPAIRVQGVRIWGVSVRTHAHTPNPDIYHEKFQRVNKLARE